MVRLNVKAAIEAHLADPKLDLSTVAAAAGISVRYANLVLAEEHTSISRLILDRRLERCRIALGDPKQAHRSVSEIAYGWGFSDMTHFGRRFKEAYGILPRDYRKAHNSVLRPSDEMSNAGGVSRTSISNPRQVEVGGLHHRSNRQR